MQNRILTFDQFVQQNQPEIEPGIDSPYQQDMPNPGAALVHGKPEPLIAPDMPSMSTGEFPTDPYAQPVVPEMPQGEEETGDDQTIQRLEEPNTPTQKLDETWRRYSRRIS